MTNSTVHLAISEVITAYNELNSPVVDELTEEPSPLEFMRYVARNQPFVVRKVASSWDCCQKWNAAYLLKALQSRPVNIAITPHGNADSPTFSQEHGETLFVKPLEEELPFDTFLEYIMNQEETTSPATEVQYAQTQNDNLRGEYQELFPDAPSSIPFAHIALQGEPDAVNMWIGNSKSITATHKDNYENIFVQVRGRKHFVLLPPLSFPCMNEQFLTPATYARNDLGFSLDLDEHAEKVPFATWDPDNSAENVTPFSALARPMRVTLNPGDMLYLPAMWYHKVTQACIAGEEPFVVAINYWYDMEYTGPHYPFAQFQRNVTLATQTEL